MTTNPTGRQSRHTITRNEPEQDTLTVATKCPVCGKTGVLEVSRAGYYAWINGTLIQRALPGLTKSQREQLLTGIDDACWDRLFKAGDDGEAPPLVHVLAKTKGAAL
jgi:hypothetical protein